MRKISIALIVAVHLTWLVILIVSLPLVFLRPHYNVDVLYIVGFTLLIQLFFWSCPLTLAENKLRGIQAYPEKTFIGHYLKVLFNLHIRDRVINVITACYLIAIILVSVLKFF